MFLFRLSIQCLKIDVKVLKSLNVDFSSFLGAYAKLRTATNSFVMSVYPSVLLSAWNNSAPRVRIFMKFGIWVCFQNLSRKSSFIKIWRAPYMKNNIHFAHILLSSSWNEKYFRRNSQRKSKHIFYIQYFFFRKSYRLWDKKSKVKQSRYRPGVAQRVPGI
jgi:hypothetical protein